MSDRLESLHRMRQEFQEQAAIYRDVAKGWRSRNFSVAAMLGVLPVLTGGAILLPEWLRSWAGLALSMLNVFVVVVQVKLDMGERIADAASAAKGFNKIAVNLKVFLNAEECNPGSQCIHDLFVQMAVVLRFVEEGIQFPATAKALPDENSLKCSSLRSLTSNSFVSSGEGSKVSPDPDVKVPDQTAAACASDRVPVQTNSECGMDMKLHQNGITGPVLLNCPTTIGSGNSHELLATFERPVSNGDGTKDSISTSQIAPVFSSNSIAQSASAQSLIHQSSNGVKALELPLQQLLHAPPPHHSSEHPACDDEECKLCKCLPTSSDVETCPQSARGP